MEFVTICIHCVWSVKQGEPVLSNATRYVLFEHIKKYALEKGIHIDRLNGYVDHVHCLLWLQPSQTVDEVVKRLMNDSAYWLNNKSGIDTARLEWDDAYIAVSVSESMLSKMRMYIDNQENIHLNRSFGEEYEAMMKMYHFPNA